MDRRLFVGVFPSAEEARGWREALRSLSPAPPGFRPVPESHRHVTLWFLGDVPEGRLADLEAILGRAAAPVAPFRSFLSGCVLFPDERRPRVVALGVPDAEGEWAALAGSLRKPLKAGGFELEERPFHPHLTLARLTDPGRAAAALPVWRAALAGVRIPWSVGSYQLVQSRLGPEGARYEVLSDHPLGKGV